MDILSKYSPTKVSLFQKSELEYLFIAILSFIIFFTAVNTYGLGITNDSVNYLSAAKSILEGMKKADGTPFTEWPPLFPCILSISNFINMDILLFAKLLQGVVYVCISLIMVKFFKLTIQSKSIYFVALILILFSAPLLQVHVILWSEPIFILLILINIFLIHTYATNPGSKVLIPLILTGALMYLQRKTGIIFIASTSVLILYFHSSKIKGIVFSAIYLLCCSIPVYLWYQRRYEIAGKILGSGGFQPEKFFTYVEQFLNTFTSYFFPSQIPLVIRILILLVLLACLIFVVFKNKQFSTYLKEKLYLKIAAFITVFYYLTLLVSMIYIQIDDELDDRILSPVYLPLCLCVMMVLDAAYIAFTEHIKEYSWLFIIPLFLWSVYPLVRSSYHIHRWNTIGTGGYNTSHWHGNQLLIYFARTTTNTGTVYSNNIYPLHYYLNFVMNKNFRIIPEENLKQENAKSLLVCFEKQWTYPEKECSAESIEKKELLIKTLDGEIWQLNKK